MEDLMLMEILKELQKKYQSIVEIERITREMGDFLSRNDRTSVQMLLGMRKEEMDKADNCEKRIQRLLAVLPDLEEAQVRGWTKGKKDKEFESSLAKLIYDRGASIQMILKRTIEVDRYICTKLAGQNSYYK